MRRVETASGRRYVVRTPVKKVPAGIERNSLTVLCSPPVSLVDPQMCQTSDGMRQSISSSIGIILWSALTLQSLKVSVSVRCGENEKEVTVITVERNQHLPKQDCVRGDRNKKGRGLLCVNVLEQSWMQRQRVQLKRPFQELSATVRNSRQNAPWNQRVGRIPCIRWNVIPLRSTFRSPLSASAAREHAASLFVWETCVSRREQRSEEEGKKVVVVSGGFPPLPVKA